MQREGNYTVTIQINYIETIDKKADCLILPVLSGDSIVITPSALEAPLQETVKKALQKNDSFKAKSGECLNISLPDHSTLHHLVLLGLGKGDDITAQNLQQAGGKLIPSLKSLKISHPVLITPDFPKDLPENSVDIMAHIGFGAHLRSYSFEKYKSKKNDDDNAPKLDTLLIAAPNAQDIEEAAKPLNAITQGVFFARDFVNEPPNVLYPESFAQALKTELKPLGIDVEILDDKKMEKMGMGGITAVGKGSERKPRMVIMRWSGGSTDEPLALVGKGVTFDTGGISLKPGAGMEEMKMDMGGAAAVVGTMKAIALRKSRANVIGIVGLAENMPSSNAYRPADILTSHAGKTVEVLNTDAEGRLVLIDCLSYVQKTYKPKLVIDLATLTGAMMVALGHEYCGAFVNNDELWNNLEKAGQNSDEKIWRMPLDPEWKKQVEGNIADVQNLGKTGRWAGACTAAGFLEHFIEDGTPWAHLDIAGTAWIKADKPTVPKFGTGYGVRLLDRFIAQNHEA